MVGRSIEREDQGPEGLKWAAQLLGPEGQPLPPRSLSQSSVCCGCSGNQNPRPSCPPSRPELGLEGRGLSAVSRGCS